VAGARKPDASKTPLNKRAYTFRLTFSRLLTSVIVALIGLGWVFMLGVMAGRGYNPDAKLQELTGRVLRGRQASAVQEPPQEILRPEELNFGAALRDKPLHNSTAAMGPSALPHPPAGRTNNATANSVAGNATAVQIEQHPGQPVPQGAQPVRFDFVYQVAAFRDAAQADTLRERLEGEGVRTGMDKSPARDGKSLYKVLVMRRGTEDDDRQLLAVFERLKLGPPLLRSKKPVSGGGGAR
jgi:hypothetical protein